MYTYSCLGSPLQHISLFGGFCALWICYILLTLNEETAEFIAFLESNPYTSVEELFIDFFGKHRARKITINSILSELDTEERIKMIQILNTVGFDDIL